MRLRRGIAGAAAILGMAVLAACGGGGGGGAILPGPGNGNFGATSTPSPNPTPSNSPNSSTVCTNNGAPQSIVKAAVAESVTRRMPNFARQGGAYVPGVIEVVYQAPILNSHRTEAAQLVQHVQGDVRSEMDFSSDRIQIVTVAPGTEDAAIRQFTSSGIVKSATRSVERRLQSTTPATLNDPFYNGFAPANVPPFYEAASTPGQWDMHVVCAANAWGYGNANTTGTTFPGALGGNVKIAIVDTGADLTHPDLAGRVVYAESVLNGIVTPGVAGMHDNDGHGTDVAGIAAASGNNNFGFSGVAYAAPLMIFKVFPDGPCSGGCTASGADVGQAITDAVAQGARVISLSLGASGPDTAEEAAVARAIASGVVVVAASGNESSATLDYPGADPGVIAVGASSLVDSNSSSVTESVAGYSNYDAANMTWGVVAPGGDPTGSSDSDDLHWIENIYSSTTGAGNFCSPDRSGATDCRVLIAGTSQATPHVSGAVALMLSVNGLLTPALVKADLCMTARNINNPKQGCGRLDAYRAVAKAVNDPNP